RRFDLIARNPREFLVRRRRHGAANSNCRWFWKQCFDLRVDAAKILPAPLYLRKELWTIATHLFRRLPRIEHLFEQREYVGNFAHRTPPHGIGVSLVGSAGAAGFRSASLSASKSRARFKQRCTVFAETPTTPAASV